MTPLVSRSKLFFSLLDKCLLLPLGIYLIVFDIICFAKYGFETVNSYDFRMYMMTAAFYYVAVVYIFQGIYHYYHPIPLMVQAIKEAEEAEREKALELEQNKTPEETPEVIENKAEEKQEETNLGD